MLIIYFNILEKFDKGYVTFGWSRCRYDQRSKAFLFFDNNNKIVFNNYSVTKIYIFSGSLYSHDITWLYRYFALSALSLKMPLGQWPPDPQSDLTTPKSTTNETGIYSKFNTGCYSYRIVFVSNLEISLFWSHGSLLVKIGRFLCCKIW